MDENTSAEIIGLAVGIALWMLNRLRDKQSDIWLCIDVLKSKLVYLIHKLLKI